MSRAAARTASALRPRMRDLPHERRTPLEGGWQDSGQRHVGPRSTPGQYPPRTSARAVPPAAIEVSRRSKRVGLLDAGYAIPLAFVLGLVALVMARRARDNLRWLRVRDGGTGVAGGTALGGGISLGYGTFFGLTDDTARLEMRGTSVAGNQAVGGSGGAGADGGVCILSCRHTHRRAVRDGDGSARPRIGAFRRTPLVPL